jgi:hypothetical protein
MAFISPLTHLYLTLPFLLEVLMPSEQQKISVKLALLEFKGKRAFGLCIKHKQEVLAWRVLARIVLVLTFGQVNLLEKFWSTIGNVVYVPKRVDPKGKVLLFGDLPFEDYRVLSHELVHVEDFYRFGFPSVKGGRAVGVALFILIYVFLFFPVGLAYGRYRLERKAYLAGLIAAKRCGGYDITAQAEFLRRAVRSCSTSPWYLWPWPFPQQVQRWFEHQLDLAEAAQDQHDAPTSPP